MGIHEENINFLKSHHSLSVMRDIGFLKMDIEGDEVVFTSAFDAPVRVSLDDTAEIRNTLASLQARRAGLGFNTGFNLDPRKTPKVKLDRNLQWVQEALGLKVGDKVSPMPEEYLRIHGISRNQKLMNLYRDGYRVQQQIFSPDDHHVDEVIDHLKSKLIDEKTGIMHGNLWKTQSGIAVQQVYDPSGKALSINEIYGLFGTEFGAGKQMSFTELLGKGSKRARALFQQKALSATAKSADINVAVFDPTEMFGDLVEKLTKEYTASGTYGDEAAAAAKKTVSGMFDGFNIVTDIKLLTDTFQKSQNIEIGLRVKDSPTYRIQQLQDQANKALRALKQRSGRGNFRLTGGNILEVSGGLSKSSQWYREKVDKGVVNDFTRLGQIKGDINLTKTLDELDELIDEHPEFARLIDFVKNAREKGAMMIVPTTNIGTEAGALNTGEAILSLNPYGDSGVVRTNPIALAAHPEFFDMDQITKESKERLSRTYEKLAAGEITDELRAHIEKTAGMVMEDIDETLSTPAAVRMQNAITEARSIMVGLDLGMDIRADPGMMSMVRSAALNYEVRPSGKPSLVVPNAHRAHFTSEVTLTFDSDYNQHRRRGGSMYQDVWVKNEETGKAGKNRMLKKNYVTYNRRTHSFVLPDIADPEDLSRVLELFGGADFDDAMAGILRYDKENKVMRLLSYRDPTARGENEIFKMGIEDALVRDQITAAAAKGADPELTRIVEERRQALAAISRQQKEIKKLKQQEQIIWEDKPWHHRYQSLVDYQGDGHEELRAEMQAAYDRMDALKTEYKTIQQEFTDRLPEFAEKIFRAYDPTERPAQYVGKGSGAHRLKMVMGEHAPDVVDLKQLADDVPTRQITDAAEYIETAVRSQADKRILGQGINYMTMLDSLFNTKFDDELIGGAGIKPESIVSFLRESLIDTVQQEGAGATQFIEENMKEGGRKIAQRLVELGPDTDVKLPYYLVSDQADALNKIPGFVKDAMNEVLHDAGMSLADVTSTREGDTSIIGEAMRASKEIEDFNSELERTLRNTVDSVSPNSFPMNPQLTGTVDELMSRLAEHKEHFELDLLEDLKDEIDPSEKIARRAQVNDALVQDIFAAARDQAKANKTGVRETLQDILLMMRSQAGDDLGSLLSLSTREGHHSTSLKTMLQNAYNTHLIAQQERRAIIHPGMASDVDLERARELVQSLEVPDEILGVSDGRFRRAARETADNVSSIISGIRAPEGISLGEGLRKLWDMGSVRNATLATAAVAAASVIYQGSKERTADDMAGPAFLPGGSAYESGMSGSGGSGISSYNFAPGGGTTYSINARGNHDPYEFASRAGALAGTSAFGTISTAQSSFSDYDRAISNNY